MCIYIFICIYIKLKYLFKAYIKMGKTKKYTLLKAIFQYSLRNFVKLKNMKIFYKVLRKLQVVNKLSKQFYYKRLKDK